MQCTFTEDISKLKKASAVIFHLPVFRFRDLAAARELNIQLPSQRRAGAPSRTRETAETNPVPIVPVPKGWGRGQTARHPVHKSQNIPLEGSTYRHRPSYCVLQVKAICPEPGERHCLSTGQGLSKHEPSIVGHLAANHIHAPMDPRPPAASNARMYRYALNFLPDIGKRSKRSAAGSKGLLDESSDVSRQGDRRRPAAL